MHSSYYYRAHACIMVFDVTRKVTYKNLEKWYDELQQHCKGIPTVVVANKIDIDYKVTSKSFNFAAKRKLPFFFVSASDGTNVVKARQSPAGSSTPRLTQCTLHLHCMCLHAKPLLADTP